MLSREDLLRLFDCVRAMTHASAAPDYDDALDALLRVAAEATESDRANVFFVDEPKGHLVLAGVFPRDGGLAEKYRTLPLETRTGSVMTSGRSATWNIEEAGAIGAAARPYGVQEVAAVPLFVQGKATAVMNLVRHQNRPYDEAQLRFAQVLGELLVVYLENARLYADAQRRLEETRALLDVGRRLHASIELEPRLSASVEALVRLVDASRAFLVLLEDGGTVLHGVAASDPALREDFRLVRIPMDAPSIAVRAVKTRRAVVVEDARSAEDVNRELVERYGEMSLLALPLLVQDEPIGAVVIDDGRRTRSWTRSEIERAELIAQSVAVAVANSRLYEEVLRRSSELERAQQELLQRERLAALGQLAATLAHEVRNPLGVMFNSLGTLGKMLPADGDAATLLAIMSEEAVRLERLVRELLDFARPLAPSLEPESLRTVVEGAVDAASREVGTAAAALTAEISADLPPVRLDASMIRRAIVNLVVNGVQAAGPSGRVRVCACLERRAGRRFARIDVIDSGPGISRELASRIFEPFFTTKATGTGLGLAVVKSIVDSHGGEITVDSRVGATTVSLFVPAEPDSTEMRAATVRAGW
jgi:signal transduction histidine kinase